MKTRIHAIAGAIALVLVSCFWSSTVIAELWLSPEAAATVKHAIVYGVALLIPAMVVAGGSDFCLRDRGVELLSMGRKGACASSG